jgi:hypothetical protein
MAGCAFVLGVSVLAAGRPDLRAERSIFLTALDKDNTPIRGLQPADFVVREDGEKREIIRVTAPEDPLFVSLLIDTSKPPMGVDAAVQDLRKSLLTFVQTVQGASADAQIAMIEFAGAAVTTVNFTKDTTALEKQIKRLFPSQRASGVMLEAFIEASKALGKRASPRRAIVSLNFASAEASTGATEERRRRDPQVRRDRVGGLDTGSQRSLGLSGRRQRARQQVVADTRADPERVDRRDRWHAAHRGQPTALEGMLKKIADCLNAQYVVTYAQPAGAPAQTQITPSARGAAKVLMAPWMQ